jgi:hypothetical protein
VNRMARSAPPCAASFEMPTAAGLPAWMVTSTLSTPTPKAVLPPTSADTLHFLPCGRLLGVRDGCAPPPPPSNLVRQQPAAQCFAVPADDGWRVGAGKGDRAPGTSTHHPVDHFQHPLSGQRSLAEASRRAPQQQHRARAVAPADEPRPDRKPHWRGQAVAAAVPLQQHHPRPWLGAVRRWRVVAAVPRLAKVRREDGPLQGRRVIVHTVAHQAECVGVRGPRVGHPPAHDATRGSEARRQLVVLWCQPRCRRHRHGQRRGQDHHRPHHHEPAASLTAVSADDN